MKNYYFLLLLFYLFSCKINEEKTKICPPKTEDIQYLQYGSTDFTSNMLNSTYLFNNSFKNSYKVSSSTNLYKKLKENLNFDDLYYYSYIDTKDSFETLVLFYYSDYVKSFLLVTIKNNKIIDILDISSSTGHVEDNGFENYDKESDYNYTTKDFFSSFNDRYLAISCPIDTTTYYKKGRTRIWIDEKGKIHEDTLEVKRNFITTEKNLDCE
ncbi:hypothetical protein ETU08_08185 [Apibacter muscae]|uniref:hypothetical protein n=1 Tax=Apibacter muscae TaxID=2509004 RepID=UPI0011AD287D|nr:hypothetical protein [Apibacter muscae]TWP28921.1 hypothetical protein ETU08_08185 [Apibacter muscae]